MNTVNKVWIVKTSIEGRSKIKLTTQKPQDFIAEFNLIELKEGYNLEEIINKFPSCFP